MIHTPIFFWLSIAAVVVASFFHIRSSQNFLYYGQSESNPLWKDKYGFFAPMKYIVSLAVFIAVIAAVHLAWMGYQTGIAFYIMAGAFVGMTLMNNADAKKQRAKQIDVLRRLNSLATDENVDGTDPAVNSIMQPHPIVTKGGRSFYKLFGWLNVDNSVQPPTGDTIVALRNKIINWSRRPEKDWFLK